MNADKELFKKWVHTQAPLSVNPLFDGSYLLDDKQAIDFTNWAIEQKVNSITDEAFQLLKEDLDDLPLTEDEIEIVYYKIEKHQNKLLKQ